MENNLPQLRISEEQLPGVIDNTFKSITEIDQTITETVCKANKAKDHAEIASTKKAGWSIGGKDKRVAIEALQEAAILLSDALCESTSATKQLFENQQKMSESIRYLFGLGVANMAANRAVVRELELKLRNASEEELSDLARQEITNVVLQLRAQEDMWNRLKNHDNILREHKNSIDEALSEISSFEKGCKEVLEHTKTLQTDVNAKKEELSDQFDAEKRNFQDKIARLTKELSENISELSGQLSSSIENQVTSAFQVIEPRLLSLEQYREQEIAKRTFFSTKFYKAIVGIISLSALIISLVNLLCN